MLSRRKLKLSQLAARSQLDLTICLENVHDPHNISAVMRSCDAIGIREIYVLYTDPQLQGMPFAAGKRSSSGSSKWVKVHVFEHADACFETLRNRYGKIYTTHLASEAKDLYELDLTGPMALLFGNERDGVSQYALECCDGNFVIPTVGMVPSLNISVACAVTLFEAYRQRRDKGFYEGSPDALSEQKLKLLHQWMDDHLSTNP